MSTNAPAPLATKVRLDARVAVIAARFNAQIVEELTAGCRRRLAEADVASDRVELFQVPGAFELPVAAKAAAATGRFAAVVCLGCVIRGDTPHFDYVAGEAARGIANVSIETGIPVIFGVLTTNTQEQARDRIGGSQGHAGERAAEAALEMIAALDQIRQTK